MNFLNKLEKKFGKYGISHLMTIIIVISLFTLCIGYFDQTNRLNNILYFNRDLILQGQVWRLITFIFVPDIGGLLPFWGANLFFTLFSLYFFYLIGNSLEGAWGTFKFNVYYFLGVLLTIIAGMFTGFADASYLNLTLFFAFATIFPNYELLLFFMLPIKVKYIAIFNAVILLASLVLGSFSIKITIIVSVLNYFIFFGKSIYEYINLKLRYGKGKTEFKNRLASSRYEFKTKKSNHKCEVCGRTEISNPELQFRYCSKCIGKFEYCEEHINEHVHKDNVVEMKRIK